LYDINDTLRPSSLPPSRLSFVETFAEDDRPTEPEVKAKKEERHMFSWMKKRVA
jgi:hypothetical protein